MIELCGWQVYRDASGGYVLRKRFQLTSDAFEDAKRLYPAIRTIFDVGANVGQTAVNLRRCFPHATIYSFEPDGDSFARLEQATRGLRVHCIRAAVGRTDTEARLHRYRFGETNSLLPKSPEAGDFVVDHGFFEEIGSSEVKVVSIDSFCAEDQLSQIDLLKIDTQGYELEVLNGATQALARPVPLIYTEVTFIRYYLGQPLFPDVYGFLYERGYRLVGLYESGFLTHYYQVGGNALFIHERHGQRVPRQHLSFGPVRVET